MGPVDTPVFDPFNTQVRGKDQSQVPQGIPGIDFVREGPPSEGKSEAAKEDTPFDFGVPFGFANFGLRAIDLNQNAAAIQSMQAAQQAAQFDRQEQAMQASRGIPGWVGPNVAQSNPVTTVAFTPPPSQTRGGKGDKGSVSGQSSPFGTLMWDTPTYTSQFSQAVNALNQNPALTGMQGAPMQGWQTAAAMPQRGMPTSPVPAAQPWENQAPTFSNPTVAARLAGTPTQFDPRDPLVFDPSNLATGQPRGAPPGPQVAQAPPAPAPAAPAPTGPRTIDVKTHNPWGTPAPASPPSPLLEKGVQTRPAFPGSVTFTGPALPGAPSPREAQVPEPPGPPAYAPEPSPGTPQAEPIEREETYEIGGTGSREGLEGGGGTGPIVQAMRQQAEQQRNIEDVDEEKPKPNKPKASDFGLFGPGNPLLTPEQRAMEVKLAQENQKRRDDIAAILASKGTLF
jgi:hypothetical protein